MTYFSESAMKEDAIESHFASSLVKAQGYVELKNNVYDKTIALIPSEVISYIQRSQPNAWKQITNEHRDRAEEFFVGELTRRLRDSTALDILRNGIKIILGRHGSVTVKLCGFVPSNSFNELTNTLYDENRFSIIRQLQCKAGIIDTVMFLNGLPFTTIEFKNNQTGQTFRDAEDQYRNDRQPFNDPLLTAGRGALVHFAIDEVNASMTTALDNERTVFLPFNRGNNGGSGNAPVENEMSVAYFYNDIDGNKAVFSKDMVLAVIQKYIHEEDLSLEERKRSSRVTKIIFPRYHQLEAVSRLIADVKSNEGSRNYLLQHSAGSGKTNTIAWTAHQLHTLQNDNGTPIFDAVIIVSDRKVLDKQLQKKISTFEQTPGVVKRIEENSEQLKIAIEGGAKIIVTTIQKFGTEKVAVIKSQKERRFAVIIDEAHSSQTGKNAVALNGVLSNENVPEDFENAVRALQRMRGPNDSISYFAFTATPKAVTLERFGTRVGDEKPAPFHSYTMRQAIEERYILDVLANYMTFKTYYEVVKIDDRDPTVRIKLGNKKVADFANKHPRTIREKCGIIVDHFNNFIRPSLEGRGKAMIVCESREQALAFYREMKARLHTEGFGDEVMIAFSGTLKEEGFGVVSEASLNGVQEELLPKVFNEYDNKRFLIVADKYQTGFDEPLLFGMYVDKPLSGIQAVQTLSRLNRSRPGKENPFVLDFRNEKAAIVEAFQPYYETTEIEEPTNPNHIFSLWSKIRSFSILDIQEMNDVAKLFIDSKKIDAPSIRNRIEGILQRCADRYAKTLDFDQKNDFRSVLKSFCRFYQFVSQLYSLDDEELYTGFIFCERLLRTSALSPNATRDGQVDESLLILADMKIKKKRQSEASLIPGKTLPLKGISRFALSQYSDENKDKLSSLLMMFNQKFGFELNPETCEAMSLSACNIVQKDKKLQNIMRNNPKDVAIKQFSDKFRKQVYRNEEKKRQFIDILKSDKLTSDEFASLFFDVALDALLKENIAHRSF